MSVAFAGITVDGGVPDLDFDDHAATLHLSGVPRDDKSDLYVQFIIDKPGTRLQKEYFAMTKVVNNAKDDPSSSTPFEDEVQIDVPLSAGLPLRARVILFDKNHGRGGADDVIGTAVATLSHEFGTVGPVAVRLSNLARYHSDAQPTISFTWEINLLGESEEYPKGVPRRPGYGQERRPTGGLIYSALFARPLIRLDFSAIKIHHRLPDLDAKRGSGTSDPFLQLIVYGPETNFIVQTAVQWNEELVSYSEKIVTSLDVPEMLASKPVRLRAVLWDKDVMKDDDYIGAAEYLLVFHPSGKRSSASPSRIKFGRRATELILLDQMPHPTLSFDYSMTRLGVIDRRRHGVEKYKGDA